VEANQTLHDVWPSAGLVDYMYIFGGCCPLSEFCPMQNSLCVQLLHSHWQRYCTARHQRAWAKLWLPHATRNGITELSQRAPPIFGWAAITLGIGPHSSCEKCWRCHCSEWTTQTGLSKEMRSHRYSHNDRTLLACNECKERWSWVTADEMVDRDTSR